MNIFYLDEDMKLNAEYHCDKHVVKMITEHGQLLSSAYYFTEQKYTMNELLYIFKIYQLTHIKHPCSIWVRESLSNWIWLRDMTNILYTEYKYRYHDRVHLAGEKIKNFPIPNIQDIGITKRPICMPEAYKTDDAITSYRNYYINDKQHLMQYTKREIPQWFLEGIRKLKGDC